MRILFLLLVFLIFMTSCVTKYQGRKLSVFTVNSKTKNNKIINRFPDYGDGHKDGCIIMFEMKVDLNLRKEGVISGLVSDVYTKVPLTSASVKLLSKSGKEIALLTDKDGKFVAPLGASLSRLQVSCLSYRGFVVEL
jgi:hypothetical protein